MQKIFSLLLVVVLWLGLNGKVKATEPLRLSLEEATELFLRKNLHLLMEQYNIDMAAAEVIQSKIWDNPSLSVSNMLYNPENNKFFGAGDPQFTVEIEQVIVMGGKRKKAREIAELEQKSAEYQYYDLLRSLKFELRSTFYDLAVRLEAAGMYQQQIQQMKGLVKVLEEQHAKKNISLNELVRMKSFVFDLENEYREIFNDIQESKSNLSLLTGIPAGTEIVPLANDKEKTELSGYPLADLVETAKQHRVDYLAAANGMAISEKEILLAKSERWSDLTVGGYYDRAGGYVMNETGISVGIDLPLWNKNKGNIKKAEVRAEQARAEQEMATLVLENDVVNTYSKAIKTQELYRSYSGEFQSANEALYKNLVKNYLSRSISLYELIDFFESYNQTIVQLNHLRADYQRGLAEVNQAVGKDLF